MIDFLDNAILVDVQNRTAPSDLTSFPVAVSNLKYNLFTLAVWSRVCQIIWKIPIIPVFCVKLYCR